MRTRKFCCNDPLNRLNRCPSQDTSLNQINRPHFQDVRARKCLTVSRLLRLKTPLRCLMIQPQKMPHSMKSFGNGE
nr:MAG TPA: hypothetical protein [Caudoviricetes sp.]